MKRFLIAVLLSAGFAVGAPSAAVDFPTKPVHLVVPFPPGGTLDVIGRLLAQQLQTAWGQPVIVENRGGAGSAIGVDYVAKSAPNGYMLVLNAATPMVTVVHLQPVRYDLLRDLVGVTQTATIAYALAVSPKTGVKSVQELVERARAQPEKFNYSSAGNGSGPHMYMELFANAAKIRLTHVPYKGNAPAMQALLAGEVDMIFDTVQGAVQYMKGGKLLPLMVSSVEPSPALPGVPTMDSLYPGSSIPGWHGVFARAGTPKDVIEKIAADIRKAVNSPEMGGRLRAMGFQQASMDTTHFNELIRRDTERWAKVIRDNNIRAN